jgi:hypothetical protein
MILFGWLGMAAIGSVYCIGGDIERDGEYCSPRGAWPPIELPPPGQTGRAGTGQSVQLSV